MDEEYELKPCPKCGEFTFNKKLRIEKKDEWYECESCGYTSPHFEKAEDFWDWIKYLYGERR